MTTQPSKSKPLLDTKTIIGRTVTLKMKPTFMRDWIVIKETRNCLVVRKVFAKRYGTKNYIGDCYYVPRRSIEEIIL